jgi:hypothetical protein
VCVSDPAKKQEEEEEEEEEKTHTQEGETLPWHVRCVWVWVKANSETTK